MQGCAEITKRKWIAGGGRNGDSRASDSQDDSQRCTEAARTGFYGKSEE